MSTKLKNYIVVFMAALLIFGFAVWGVLLPDAEISESERRPLAKFPELSIETIMSGKFMTEFEKYMLDHFPIRDSFRTLKSITAFFAMQQKDNNDIYIEDGHASKLEYPLNLDSLEHAAQRFEFVYDSFIADRGMNVYLSLIPDKNYFMAEENGYLSIDYEKLVSEMCGKMTYAQYIDIMPMLELADYYRTDTHWRQEAIKDVAEHLAAQMGNSFTADYETIKVDKPFYGVYYGQSALPLDADEISYLYNDVLKNCIVYDYETDSYISVYDMEKLEGNDPYEMFLSGSKSLITIENPAAASDKELIIFRDSFGSSLAPLLAEGYSKITVVDIRYIAPSILDRFITFDGQDVLFIYSTSVLNNSVTIK